MTSPTTAPAPATAPTADEPMSDMTYLLGVLSLLLGALTFSASLLFGWIVPPQDDASGWQLTAMKAVGLGLFVLGAALHFDSIVGFFRQRKSFEAVNALLMSVLVVVLVVFVNMLAKRYDFWRADLTAEGLYTISEETRTLIGKLPTDVRLVALLPERGDTEAVTQILEQLDEASGKVHRHAIDLGRRDQQKLKTELDDVDLGGQRTLQEVVGVVVQTGHMGPDGWVKDRSKHILFEDLWTQEHGGEGAQPVFLGEQKVASAIQELVEGERPRLYFLSGHGEATLEDFDEQKGLGQLATLLRARNMQVESLKLGLGDAGRIPADCALLVVAGPRAPITEPEAVAIREYLERGGDAVLCLEPHVESAGRRTRFLKSGLEGLVSELYGADADDSMIYGIQAVVGGVVPETMLRVQSLDPNHPITAPLLKRDVIQVAIDASRPITLVPRPGVVQATLAKMDHTGPELFSTENPLLITRERKVDDPRRGPFTLFVACERTVVQPPPAAGAEAPKTDAAKRSRVVVTGDVDWLANGLIGASYTQNLEVFLNGAFWCTEREQKIVGEAKRPKSYKLEMQDGTKSLLMLLAVVGFPALAVTLGVFAWMIRRR